MFIINKPLPSGSKKSKQSSVPAFPKGQSIPKIIHQTFYRSDLPDELQKNVHRLKNLNPGWEYRFYDDNAIIDFLKTNYPPHILNHFESIDSRYGAARADLFRYLLLYKCGGMYLDIKSSATKPLDSVLKEDDEYLLSHWQNKAGEAYEGWGCHEELNYIQNGEFQQWHIISVPGHPFLKAVIETVLQNIKSYNPALHGVGKHGVLRLTGPIPYTLSIIKNLHNCKYRLIDSTADLGLAYSVYDKRAHTNIFKNHYTALNFPVAKVSFANQLVASLIYSARRIRRALLN